MKKVPFKGSSPGHANRRISIRTRRTEKYAQFAGHWLTMWFAGQEQWDTK